MKYLYKIKKLLKKVFKFVLPSYHYLWSMLSSYYYRQPSDKLIVIGVTGTTGKTSSVYLIAKTLREAGFKVGYSSTAMFSDGNNDWLNTKKMTMPGRSFTQHLLKKMLKNDCTYAVIETTSEGIRQFRHVGVNYDSLVFTGLFPEHIESHGSFEKYKQAKQKLFKYLKGCKVKYTDDEHRVVAKPSKLKSLELNKVKKTIIANGDDQHAPDFLKFWAQAKIAYTSKSQEEYSEILEDQNKNLVKELEVLSYGNILVSGRGISFRVNNKEINLQLLGEFNVLNVLNVVAVGELRNIPFERIKSSLESIKGIPGRLEQIREGQDFLCIVDYAYEPRAVQKLYDTVELLRNYPKVGTSGKIIHVLGSAGGGRDKDRRPELGKIAGQNADYVIVSNEDPYDEDPLEIIKQVSQGSVKAGKKLNHNLFEILDRREAIAKAISLAEANDIVLLTGKGSEQAICMADGKKFKWDERAVAREEIQASLK
jgi:UDP-N-acetylmuramoyl-L-alanyl-D-glutamate--2,6-diaminopimelate ligase